ncbi:hypothetical protein EMIT0158MI4_280021 [Burkholderia ambifaria]
MAASPTPFEVASPPQEVSNNANGQAPAKARYRREFLKRMSPIFELYVLTYTLHVQRHNKLPRSHMRQNKNPTYLFGFHINYVRETTSLTRNVVMPVN